MPWLIPHAFLPIVAVRSMLAASTRLDVRTVAIAVQVADAVEELRPALRGRSRRMAALVDELARACGLPPGTCERIRLAARLHRVPDLSVKPAGNDTDAHAEQAARFADRTLRTPLITEAIRFHHERFDGRGYPSGLAGEEIPLGARLLAVCESWVRLTSPSGHRPALATEEALVVLRAGAGRQWDPRLVDHLVRVVRDNATLLDQFTPGSGAPLIVPPLAIRSA